MWIYTDPEKYQEVECTLAPSERGARSASAKSAGSPPGGWSSIRGQTVFGFEPLVKLSTHQLE